MLGAEEMNNRPALPVRVKMMSANYAELGRTLYSLGVCVYTSGLTKEGGKLYQQALTFRKEKQGANNLDTARTLYSLGVFA